jgi:hypothetical protein
VEGGKDPPGAAPTHHGLGSTQRRGELGATLHGAARTVSNWTAMEPRRLQPLDPVLSAANSRLALAPIAKSGTASAHDTTSMQPEDLGTPAAMAADELQEDAARGHANVDNADLGRDWRAIVSLKRHPNTRHLGLQNARLTHVRDAN